MNRQRLDLRGTVVGRAPVSGLEVVFLSQLGPAEFVTPPVGQQPGPEETCFANCADRFALTGVAAAVAGGVCSVLAATPASLVAFPPGAALAFWLCIAASTGTALTILINCAAQCGLFRTAAPPPAGAPPSAFETDLVRELGRLDPARRAQIRNYLMQEFRRDPAGVMRVVNMAGVRLPFLGQALGLNLGGMQLARRDDDDDDDDDDDNGNGDDDNNDDDDNDNGFGSGGSRAHQAQLAQLTQFGIALLRGAAARGIQLTPTQFFQCLLQHQRTMRAGR